MSQGFVLSVLGIVIGAAIAIASSCVLVGLLFGVGPRSADARRGRRLADDGSHRGVLGAGATCASRRVHHRAALRMSAAWSFVLCSWSALSRSGRRRFQVPAARTRSSSQVGTTMALASTSFEHVITMHNSSGLSAKIR